MLNDCSHPRVSVRKYRTSGHDAGQWLQRRGEESFLSSVLPLFPTATLRVSLSAAFSYAVKEPTHNTGEKQDHGCSDRSANAAVIVEHDDEHDGIFNEADWIGIGKTWNDNLPSCVIRARDAALAAPLEMKASLVPCDTWSVAELRHSGSYTSTASSTSDTRAQQKQTLTDVASTKFGFKRASAFQQLQVVHEKMYSANISIEHPLKESSYVIVWAPVEGNYHSAVLLGRVMTMYSKTEARGSKHDWLPEATSTGAISYMIVQGYKLLHERVYSSKLCDTLGSPTFLRIPRTHILLSLAPHTSAIHAQRIGSLDLITLCPSSAAVTKSLEESKTAIAAAIKLLVRSIKSNSELGGQVKQDEEKDDATDPEVDGDDDVMAAEEV